MPVSLHVSITRQGFEVWTCVHLHHGNTVVNVIFSVRTLLCESSCVSILSFSNRHHMQYCFRGLFVQHVHDMLYVLAMFSCLFGSCLADLDGAHGINEILALFNNGASFIVWVCKILHEYNNH